MIEWMQSVMSGAGVIIVLVVAWLLCVAGVVLSCLSFSGTWLVAIASLLMLWVGDGSIGWWTVIGFLLVCVVVEVLDTLSGALGVKKVGGSRASVWVAFFAGIGGMILGAPIFPPLGSLLGMCICSFVAVYVVEIRRAERNKGDAAKVATASVIARILVILLKLVATLGMIGWLIFA